MKKKCKVKSAKWKSYLSSAFTSLDNYCCRCELPIVDSRASSFITSLEHPGPRIGSVFSSSIQDLGSSSIQDLPFPPASTITKQLPSTRLQLSPAPAHHPPGQHRQPPRRLFSLAEVKVCPHFNDGLGTKTALFVPLGPQERQHVVDPGISTGRRKTGQDVQEL